MSEQNPSVMELQARWDKIRVANLYDTLDHMGYGNQCIDLGIRPLFPHRHIVGKAITVLGSSYPVPRGEGDEWGGDYFQRLVDMVYPGSVVVVECGGEAHAGKFGEMTSWALQQKGARGIVLDSFIRDWRGLEIIPDYTPFARGTSPIESSQRWRIADINVNIGMPGTLTSRVRVKPGDWIIGGMDGVISVPEAVAMEALVKAEKLEAEEQGMRDDVAAGMTFQDAYKKWGRA